MTQSIANACVAIALALSLYTAQAWAWLCSMFEQLCEFAGELAGCEPVRAVRSTVSNALLSASRWFA